jgi:hypothetical protein
VRFQLWADELANVNAASDILQRELLGAQDALRVAGFLRLEVNNALLAEFEESLETLRKIVEYRVLYEFHFQDADGAESLISRVPIDIDSAFGESTVVTDDMVRWDEESTLALEVRGESSRSIRVEALSILAFLPDGWDGDAVTVSASVGGIIREQVFTSVRAFRDTFNLESTAVELGGNSYLAGRLDFPNADFPDPLILQGGDDVIRIHYADAVFAENAVVYLRVLS